MVHYGDTHGYDKDKRRDNAWPYRDYVIAAFNADLPFGRFIREQVAGDVLWPENGRGAIATAFIAAGPWDFVGHVELREGTVDKLKTRLLDRDDMVSSTMSTFVSMTVHCARCHDHKFDPISQTDYYRLQAVFAGVDRGDRRYQSPERVRHRTALSQRREQVAARLKSLTTRIDALSSPAVAALDDQLRVIQRQLRDTPASVSGPKSPTNGYHSAIYPQPDAHRLGPGRPRFHDADRRNPALSGPPVDFPDTPGFGFPARFHVDLSDDPTFARAERVATGERPDHQKPDDEPYVIRPSGRAARYVRVTATRLWKRLDDYVFALAELEVISAGVNRARGSDRDGPRFDRGRPLGPGQPRRRLRQPACLPGPVRCREPAPAMICSTGSSSSNEQRQRRAETLVDPTLRAERDATTAELAEIDEQLQSLAQGALVYGVQSHAPRPITVLRRGEVEQPGEPVGPGTLACLPGLPGTFSLAHPENEGTRRAALAEWLASTRKYAHLAFDRQSPLALPFRPGNRRDAQRLRPQRRPADASRAARLAGRRAPRSWSVAQGPPPSHRL